MWTENEEGEKIEIYECTNEREEAEKISYLVEEKPSEWTILYRTNGQSRTLEEALIRKGIPYEIVGGVKFYDRKEVKDIIAYLRIITTPQDSVSWKRIVNTPPRKIGPTTLERVTRYVEKNNIHFTQITQPIGEDIGNTHLERIEDLK